MHGWGRMFKETQRAGRWNEGRCVYAGLTLEAYVRLDNLGRTGVFNNLCTVKMDTDLSRWRHTCTYLSHTRARRRTFPPRHSSVNARTHELTQVITQQEWSVS